GRWRVVSLPGPALPCFFPRSLHDALPISCQLPGARPSLRPSTASFCRRSSRAFSVISPASAAASTPAATPARAPLSTGGGDPSRSEEHTSELQSRENLVCRLLLEKKK